MKGIGNPPGLNGRLELGRWLEVGVSLLRILRAATVDNAVALHFRPTAARLKLESGPTCSFYVLIG